MYAVHFVRCLNKSFSSKIQTVVSSLRCVQRNYKAKQPTSFDFRSQVKSDVVIFEHENPKYFILINIFAAVQCTFWTYLGVFLFRSLDNPALKFENNKTWATILEKEREYSGALCIVSLLFGWAAIFGTCLYSTRSIRKLILHKDGRYVTFITYNLPGYNTFRIPINNVSSVQHRTKAKKFIPIKLKDQFFYYLLDINGQFSNPALFDFTVGVKRGF